MKDSYRILKISCTRQSWHLTTQWLLSVNFKRRDLVNHRLQVWCVGSQCRLKCVDGASAGVCIIDNHGDGVTV